MASKVVFSALLLLLPPMLAAAAAMAGHGTTVYTPGQQCCTGMGFPVYALPRCRAMVKRQCVGQAAPASVREECCRQVAAIMDHWCVCEALNHMRHGMYLELGAAGEGPGQDQVFPGCRREAMDRAAASVPALCKVDIPMGSDGVCYWLPR